MDFNLFNWIREGVRRSVMLGVADAIDSVGVPAAGDDLQKSLQSFRSRIESPGTNGPLVGNFSAASPANSGRKRLGRTLKNMDPAK